MLARILYAMVHPNISSIMMEYWKVIYRGICVSNMKNQFVYVNPYILKKLGYSHKEMQGRQVLDFIYEDDIERTNEAAQQMIRDRRHFGLFVNRYKCKDGTLVKAIWTGFLLGDLFVSECEMYSIGRDDKLTERELRGEK